MAVLSRNLLILVAAATAIVVRSDGAAAQTKSPRGQLPTVGSVSDDRKTAPDGTTALHRAIVANDVEKVSQLLRDGGDPRVANRFGATPLSLAAQSGNRAVVTALLDAGADARSTSKEGEPVLMTAARAGGAAIVDELLARGADPNAKETWQGQTAVMWAAAENHGNVVKLLLTHGADPNASTNLLDYWEMTPIEQATPKVNTPKGGMSAIHFAARQGALDGVRALTSAPGTDVNKTDPDGVTALLYATLNGHYDIAAFLLDHGANPNLADRYGRTVLYAAIDMNRPESESRPAPKTEDTISPLALAKHALERGASPDARITARFPNRCSNGCNSLTLEGATPLWRATRGNDVEAVALLLEGGADPKVQARDGSTPLMVAAGQSWRDGHSVGTEHESIAIIKQFLDRGIDINAKNAIGETALHGAAARGADAVVAFLVERGAELDARDLKNRTPLDSAMGVSQVVRNGGGAVVAAPVRVSTARLLTELMIAKGLPIEPYPAAPAGR